MKGKYLGNKILTNIYRERDALVKDLELRVDSTLEQLELVKT